MNRILAIALLAGLGIMFWSIPRAQTVDTFLMVCRPGEECAPRHRYTEMTACRVDLAGEKNLDREPKGTRLVCLKVTEAKEAKAR